MVSNMEDLFLDLRSVKLSSDNKLRIYFFMFKTAIAQVFMSGQIDCETHITIPKIIIVEIQNGEVSIRNTNPMSNRPGNESNTQ